MAAGLLLAVSRTGAQSSPAAARRAPASSVLDGWIVTRYRGAQLVPEAGWAPSTLASASARPRVETIREGRGTSDTLVAVHFAPLWAAPSLAIGAQAQLVGPAGTITPLPVRIVERRAFRAPRMPGGLSARADSSWRYGWAYLALVPHTDRRPTARYRGWILTQAAAIPTAR